MDLKLGKIILAFVAIVVIVGAFIPTIFNTQDKMTDKQSVVNESYNLSDGCYTAGGEIDESDLDCNFTVDNAPEGWEQDRSVCYLSNYDVADSSDTSLTEGTDYEFYEDVGKVQMLNTTDTNESSTGGEVLTDYDYCAEGYNPDASSRSMASLIGLFAALSLLAFVIVIGVKEWINQ